MFGRKKEKKNNSRVNVVYENGVRVDIIHQGRQGEPTGTKNDDNFFHKVKDKLENGGFVKSRTIDFSNMKLTDKSAEVIAEIIKNAPNLEEISLNSNEFTAIAMNQICDQLVKLPKLEKVNISDNPLHFERDDTKNSLTAFLARSPTLKCFSAADTRMGDPLLAAMLTAAGESKSLRELHLEKNMPFTETSMGIVNALSNNPNITEIVLDADRWWYDDDFSDAMAALKHPNLLKLDMGGEYVKHLTKQNYETARDMIESALNNSGNLDFQHILAISERRPSIEYILQHEMEEAALTLQVKQEFSEKLLAKIPSMPEKGSDFSAFTKKNEHGYTALDNPDLWQHPEAAERLAGLKITREDLTRKTEKGATLLDSLAHGMRAEQIIPFLNKQDIKLGSQELLDSEGQPKAAYQALIEKGDLKPLFALDNWMKKSQSELQAVLEPLTDAQQAQIPVQSLRQEMRRFGSTQNLGR